MNKYEIESLPFEDKILTFSPPLSFEINKEEFRSLFILDFGLTLCYFGNALENFKFDLIHSFFHNQLDPNYNLVHWSLYGNLKDRARLVEDGQIVRKNDDLVHNSHCCAACGWCKYGDDDCPVLQGRLSGIICEDCAEEDDFPKNDLTKDKTVVS